MDVIRTILIILIVYYSVRFISRLLVPIALRIFMKRAQRNFQQQFGQQKQKPQKEGEVSIDSKPKTNQIPLDPHLESMWILRKWKT